MSDLLDLIISTNPANNDTGVPLVNSISFTLSGVDYDNASLQEGFFVEGPDTDQFVGPGLIELQSNVSQGDLNDFLQSPGYKGIVQGVVTVEKATNTLVTFTPTLPLVAQTLYIVNLSNVWDSALVNEITGFISFSFETGTGSIEEVPATVSTSVLSAGLTESALFANGYLEPFQVVSTTPRDRTVQISPNTSEIIVTFNKPINPATVNTNAISIRTSPISDHPQVATQSLGELAKTIEIVGNQLKIKI